MNMWVSVLTEYYTTFFHHHKLEIKVNIFTIFNVLLLNQITNDLKKEANKKHCRKKEKWWEPAFSSFLQRFPFFQDKSHHSIIVVCKCFQIGRIWNL